MGPGRAGLRSGVWVGSRRVLCFAEMSARRNETVQKNQDGDVGDHWEGLELWSEDLPREAAPR